MSLVMIYSNYQTHSVFIKRNIAMNKTRHIITWVITILLAFAFIGAGFAKVSGQEMMIQTFTLFGLPDWFRIAIGGLEVLGGLLLLIPILTGTSAFGLSILMIGAVVMHIMFTPLTGGIPAAFMFSALTYVYLTRKNVIPIFLQKHLIA